MKKNWLLIGGVAAAAWYFFLRKKTTATNVVTTTKIPTTTGQGQTLTQNDLIRQKRISTFPSKTISTSNNPAQNAYILEGQVVKPPYPIMDIYIILGGQKVPFNGWDSYIPYAPYTDIPYDIFEPIPYADPNLRFDGRVDGGKIISI